MSACVCPSRELLLSTRCTQLKLQAKSKGDQHQGLQAAPSLAPPPLTLPPPGLSFVC